MTVNDPITREQLDAIRKRLDATTPGPRKVVANRETRCIEVQPRHYRSNVLISDRMEADVCLTTHAPQDLTDLLAEVERLRARLTVDDAMVERATRAFGAATAQVSSVPLGMSEDMFIDSVGLQHQHAIRAALDVALYHTATHSKEDQ